VSPPSITGPSRKIGIVKIARPKAKPRPQSRFEIEWALVKLVGVSKKFCLLDVAAPSRRPLTGGATMTRIERAARVPAFENLGDDSSPNVCKTPSPKRIAERRASPLPSMSDEFFFVRPDNCPTGAARLSAPMDLPLESLDEDLERCL
jgi:hypothetical protein